MSHSREYGVAQVITGEVMPLRAEPGAPDTLNALFDATLEEVMRDPWPVLPPEEWTHRRVGDKAHIGAGVIDVGYLSLPLEIQEQVSRDLERGEDG